MKTKVDSFEDIIFENRNKEYGAYELRKRYSRRGAIALIISVSVLLFAVGVPLIANMVKHSNYLNYIEKNTTLDLMKVNNDVEKPTPPPPPPAPVPSKNEIKFTKLTIVDSVSNPDIELGIPDDFTRSNTPVDTTTHIIVIQEKKIEKEIPGDEIIDVVHIKEKPIFPGGDAALLKFIAENTKYPEKALQMDMEGTVYVRFVVTKTGQIGEVNVMREVDPSLDQEALRVIKSLPAWTPGKNDGYPVNVRFIIPVKFKIKH